MAIRIARCTRCQTETLVAGSDATRTDVKIGDRLWVGAHKNGTTKESCIGDHGILSELD